LIHADRGKGAPLKGRRRWGEKKEREGRQVASRGISKKIAGGKRGWQIGKCAASFKPGRKKGRLREEKLKEEGGSVESLSLASIRMDEGKGGDGLQHKKWAGNCRQGPYKDESIKKCRKGETSEGERGEKKKR